MGPASVGPAGESIQRVKRAGLAGRAAIAAVGVGSLTQDTFGDLEVIRALTVWCLLPETGSRPGLMGGASFREPADRKIVEPGQRV